MTANKPVKVLMVDDYEDTLVNYKDIFERLGYEAFIAMKAGEALEIVRAHKPQVCFIDIALLESFSYGALMQEKGLELIRKIKEISPKSKCVALAFTYNETLYLAKEFGADDVIQRPMEPEIVLDKLNILALEFYLSEK